ncbi:hypothetical protein [Flavobacterium lacisediminis]|uniref:Peptidase S74 domain-containing protein n=1 Tax=Flavobacterium lacisediminis TaxID=2989705 RepID=A0ABT3EE77_9FLAO|nr:hypothetical protein [Flavobacterium lacisediminis]MCW1146884.1 hypothetical protein [Flavobacterium lacisediminis]
MKKILLFACLLFTTLLSYSQVGINTTNPTATLHVFGNTTLPIGGTTSLLNQNFTTNDFTFVNSATASHNNWRFGSAAGNPANAIYISNDSGTTNAYGTQSNVTFAYRDVAIPTGTTTSTFSFDWRCNGERLSGTDYDYFRVWLVPNSFTPVSGTQITAGAGRIQVGANFNQQNTWTTYSNAALNISAFAGSTMRIIFEWRNDSSTHNQFPAAIDNILLSIPTAPIPGSYAFRLEDGTQAAGKVLTSDANGNGYWATPTGGGSGTDSQTLSLVGNLLSISNGNSVTLPSGSGSNTYTNGLTLTGSTVKLGGTLTQNTTLNLDTNNLIFSSSTSAAFPGEMIIQGSDRVMMDTSFDGNYINFGSGAFIDGDDGTTFSDTGNSSYTKDFVAGFHNGSSGGTAIAIGSIEYIVDGTNEIFFEGSGFSPMTNFGADLGKGSPFQSGPIRNWDDVYARNFVASSGTTYNRVAQRGNSFTKGLKEIMQLEPILYKEEAVNIGSRMSTEAERDEHIGFNVSNVLQVIPEAVKTSDWFVLKEGQDPVKMNIENPTGIMFNQIIPVVVKAIQEQQGEIEELKKEIEELKLLIKELKK